MNKSEEGSRVHQFAMVRERYFKCLKRAVSENCTRCCKMAVTDQAVDQLSLNIEQHALLASLQTEIYQKSMNIIIGDIKKVTSEDTGYHKIKDLLLNMMKNASRASQDAESYNHFHSNLKNASIFSTEPIYETDIVGNIENIVPLKSRLPDQYLELNSENVLKLDMMSNLGKSQYPLSETQDFSSEGLYMPLDHCSESSTLNCSSPSNPFYKDAFEKFKDEKCKVTKPVSRVFPQVLQNQKPECSAALLFNQQEHCAGSDFPPSHIDNDQDSVSEENGQVDHYDMKTADILQILEDENNSDSCHSNDSQNILGDVSENLQGKNIAIEIMPSHKIRKKSFLEFGKKRSCPDEVRKKFGTGKSANLKTDVTHPKDKVKTIDWKLEKNIQMYKFSIVSSQMSEEDRIKNEIIFLELFGEDSDREEEYDYSCYNLYWTSCVERISPWVVENLMPYYRQNRIIGRNVFKKLGHVISKLIIKKVEYPDEWLVQQVVSKFFNNRTIYTCEEDVAEINLGNL